MLKCVNYENIHEIQTDLLAITAKRNKFHFNRRLIAIHVLFCCVFQEKTILNKMREAAIVVFSISSLSF